LDAYRWCCTVVTAAATPAGSRLPIANKKMVAFL
jgi:hypothetical protein